MKMKYIVMIMLATAAASMLQGAALAQGMSAQDQIAQAVSPLPEMLRADATVVTYNKSGDPVVLRQGSNAIVCTPNQGGTTFAVNCYQKIMRAQNDMQAKLRAEGKDGKAIQAAIQEARASGKLPAVPVGIATYSRLGKTDADSRVTWRIMMPGATAESSGLPDKKGAQGEPWLQLAGTPNAHIHIK